MDKGIYTALSGGIAKSHDLELISNNLANANTPGYKRDSATFNEYLTEVRRFDNVGGLQREIDQAALTTGRPGGDKSYVEMDGVYTDWRQGGMQKTGGRLDFAIQGKGFFEVLTPSGPRFTRAGNFQVNNNGVLVNASGHPVLSRDPKLAQTGTAISPDSGTPPERRIIRLEAGQVFATPDGNLNQGGIPVAQLSIVEFHEPQWLEKEGNSLYLNTSPDNFMRGNIRQTQIQQGFIETSNVNPIREMTKLIEATRAYESHMQAIKTYQQIDTRAVNDIAFSR